MSRFSRRGWTQNSREVTSQLVGAGAYICEDIRAHELGTIYLVRTTNKFFEFETPRTPCITQWGVVVGRPRLVGEVN